MNQMMAIRNAFANPAAARRQAMYIQSARDNALARARRPISPEEQALQEMDPVDAYKLSQELENKRVVSPEQAATNQKQNARDLLSIIPGPGNVIAAEDAVTGAGNALSAVREGAYGRAALEGGMALLSGVGAITGMPTGRIAGDAARGAKDSLSAFPAYHGSPHDFDKFDMSKLGTGEGAQAYGHGLYFAENPAVGKSYLEDFRERFVNVDGKVIDDDGSDLWQIARAKLDGGEAGIKKLAADTDANIAMWESEIKKAKDDPWLHARLEEAKAFRSQIDDVAKTDVKPVGRLYHTEIDAEPHQLLDWDKPLSQQSEYVQAALKKQIPDWDSFKHKTGGDYVQYGIGKGNEHIVLGEAGIPGIRYLDQGSRGSGAGSSNFVIFDDKLTKILSKE